jgi:hypothetical protein
VSRSRFDCVRQQALQDQVSDQGPLSEWIDTARDVKLWNDIIDKCHEIACQLSFTITSDVMSNQVTAA